MSEPRTVIIKGTCNTYGTDYEDEYEATDETDDELREIAQQMADDNYDVQGWFEEVPK